MISVYVANVTFTKAWNSSAASSCNWITYKVGCTCDLNIAIRQNNMSLVKNSENFTQMMGFFRNHLLKFLCCVTKTYMEIVVTYVPFHPHAMIQVMSTELELQLTTQNYLCWTLFSGIRSFLILVTAWLKIIVLPENKSKHLWNMVNAKWVRWHLISMS